MNIPKKSLNLLHISNISVESRSCTKQYKQIGQSILSIVVHMITTPIPQIQIDTNVLTSQRIINKMKYYNEQLYKYHKTVQKTKNTKRKIPSHSPS